MKKIIAVILILTGVAVSSLSIREYAGKKKSIDFIGYEFSITNRDSQKVFYRNTAIGLVILAGGVVLLSKRKRN